MRNTVLFLTSFILVSTFIYGCDRHKSANEVAVTSMKTLLSPHAPVIAPNNVVPTKTVVKYVLPPDRTVYITGSIGMEDSLPETALVADKITNLGQSSDPIYVVLSSPGGSIIDGAMILTAMEGAKGPVYTICKEVCASMAAIIFEYGTKRLAVDRSFVMFHPASGGAGGEIDKVVSRLTSIQHYIGKMEAFIANRANLSFEKYKELSSKELWVDAEDAVNTGFADEVVTIVVPSSDGMFSIPKAAAKAPTKTPSFVTIDPVVAVPSFVWETK